VSSGPSKPHSEPCEPAARLIVRKAGRPGGPGPVVVRLRVAEKQLGGVAGSGVSRGLGLISTTPGVSSPTRLATPAPRMAD
jgi:hypothetical protein